MDEATPERWLAVPGYKGLYEVSDLGNVWSAPRATTRGGLLKRTPATGGYLWVTLTRKGTQKRVAVHRLVTLAFIGPLPKGLETRHLDGNPANNRLSNLMYGTHDENMQDMVRHGRSWTANKTHCPKNHEYTEDNTLLYEGRRFCRTCKRVEGARRQREYDARKRRPLNARSCEQCGVLFMPLKRSNARFCSVYCGSRIRREVKEDAARRERASRVVNCAQCDQPFTAPVGRQRYCAPKCRRRAEKQRAKNRR